MSDSIESVRASVINHELERENADLQAQLEAVRKVYEYAKRTESIHEKAINLYLLTDVRERLKAAIGEVSKCDHRYVATQFDPVPQCEYCGEVKS